MPSKKWNFLKIEQDLIRINPEKNYFSPKNNLNLPDNLRETINLF